MYNRNARKRQNICFWQIFENSYRSHSKGGSGRRGQYLAAYQENRKPVIRIPQFSYFLVNFELNEQRNLHERHTIITRARICKRWKLKKRPYLSPLSIGGSILLELSALGWKHAIYAKPQRSSGIPKLYCRHSLQPTNSNTYMPVLVAHWRNPVVTSTSHLCGPVVLLSWSHSFSRHFCEHHRDSIDTRMDL